MVTKAMVVAKAVSSRCDADVKAIWWLLPLFEVKGSAVKVPAVDNGWVMAGCRGVVETRSVCEQREPSMKHLMSHNIARVQLMPAGGSF